MTGLPADYSSIEEFLGADRREPRDPDRERLLIVSISSMGWASGAVDFLDAGRTMADIDPELFVIGRGPKPPRRFVSAQRSSWRYGVTMLSWQRMRKHFDRLEAALDAYDAVLFISPNPALAMLPVLEAYGGRVGVYIDATLANHAAQGRWPDNGFVAREMQRQRRLFERADITIATSWWAAHSAIHDMGADEASTMVVPPSIHLPARAERSVGDSDPLQLAVIGSPGFRKGADRAVKYVEQRRGLDIELHLFGDVDPKLVDDPRVHAHGPTPRVEILDRWLPTLDLIVHPTRLDQSSWTITEAASYGIPAVASAMGGIPELIEHDVTGLLFPPDSDAQMATYLDALIADRARLARMGRAARQRAENRFDAAVNLPAVLKQLVN